MSIVNIRTVSFVLFSPFDKIQKSTSCLLILRDATFTFMNSLQIMFLFLVCVYVCVLRVIQGSKILPAYFPPKESLGKTIEEDRQHPTVGFPPDLFVSNCGNSKSNKRKASHDYAGLYPQNHECSPMLFLSLQ